MAEATQKLTVMPGIIASVSVMSLMDQAEHSFDSIPLEDTIPGYSLTAAILVHSHVPDCWIRWGTQITGAQR